MSQGEYVSLGFYERDDLAAVVAHLRDQGNVSTLGLWGRSMGAATALMHGHRDPSIAGMVVDSAFSSLEKLAEELDLWMATLVREHTSVVLSRCAFGAILTAVAAGGRLRDAAGMAPAELQRAMATFYSTLTSLAVPAFDQLQVRECARAWSVGAAFIHCRFSPSLLLFFSLSPKCPPCAEPAASRRGAHRERCADCCDVHADLRRGARANCGVRRRGAALHHASHTRPGPHPAWVSEAAAAGSSKRCARTRRHRE